MSIPGCIGRVLVSRLRVVRAGPTTVAALAGVPRVPALPLRRLGAPRGTALGRGGAAGPFGEHEVNRSGRVRRSVSRKPLREIHHGNAHRSEESCGKQQRFHGVFLLDSQQSKLQPGPGQWDLGPIVEPGSTKNDDARMVYVIRAFESLLWGSGPREERNPRREAAAKLHEGGAGDLQDVARRLTGTIPGTLGR